MDQEQALLDRARCYEESALAEIYDTISPGLYRYAMRLLGNQDLAEECVSETFSRFLGALKNGRGPSSYVQAYIYRVAHNWITDYYRRQPPPTVSIEALPLIDDQATVQQDVFDRIESQQVRRALFELTPDQRMVIVLRFLEGWPIKDVASALGKPVGAIKALQNRGLQSLRRLLLGERMP